MTDELKSCPFCGGEATYAKASRGWKVECEGRMGSCTMNARTHYQPHKFLAIAAWNTRAATPLDDPRVKALVEAGKAVIDRWDSPLWKDLRHMGESIDELRAAISALEKNK